MIHVKRYVAVAVVGYAIGKSTKAFVKSYFATKILGPNLRDALQESLTEGFSTLFYGRPENRGHRDYAEYARYGRHQAQRPSTYYGHPFSNTRGPEGMKGDRSN